MYRIAGKTHRQERAPLYLFPEYFHFEFWPAPLLQFYTRMDAKSGFLGCSVAPLEHIFTFGGYCFCSATMMELGGITLYGISDDIFSSAFDLFETNEQSL